MLKVFCDFCGGEVLPDKETGEFPNFAITFNRRGKSLTLNLHENCYDMMEYVNLQSKEFKGIVSELDIERRKAEKEAAKEKLEPVPKE